MLIRNGVVFIASSFGQVLTPSNADGGTVELLIANAIGDSDTYLNNGDDILVVAYGGGKAYVYHVDVTTADADLNTGDIEIELVGTINGVAVDSLSGINFA